MTDLTRGAVMTQCMVRALASHQCGPDSIPRLGVTGWLSFLVLYSARRLVFLLVLRFSPLLISQTTIWFDFCSVSSIQLTRN